MKIFTLGTCFFLVSTFLNSSWRAEVGKHEILGYWRKQKSCWEHLYSTAVEESILLEEAPTFFAFVSLCTGECVNGIEPANHSWRVARVDDSKKSVGFLQYIRFTLSTLISVNKYCLQSEWSEKEEKIETTKFNAAGGWGGGGVIELIGKRIKLV
jgi:hypothetical protein